MRSAVTCMTFRDAEVSCCVSCHEDAEEWGYDLIEVLDIDGSRVCCAVSRWADENEEKAREMMAAAEEAQRDA